MIFFAVSQLAPADWWVAQNQAQGVPDMQAAFSVTLGQGMLIIAGSISAFLMAQLVDVTVFHRIKAMTGERRIWLRATGSTLISQFIRQLRSAVYCLQGRPRYLQHCDALDLESTAVGSGDSIHL